MSLPDGGKSLSLRIVHLFRYNTGVSTDGRTDLLQQYRALRALES